MITYKRITRVRSYALWIRILPLPFLLYAFVFSIINLIFFTALCVALLACFTWFELWRPGIYLNKYDEVIVKCSMPLMGYFYFIILNRYEIQRKYVISINEISGLSVDLFRFGYKYHVTLKNNVRAEMLQISRLPILEALSYRGLEKRLNKFDDYVRDYNRCLEADNK